MSRLDIILFGATGFTGKYCIEYIFKLVKSDGRSLTWGVAGRSEQKLKEILSENEKKLGVDLSSIPIIKADINDYDSLKAMTGRARVIINCCGPYRFYGEPVIKACLETGTHQVDVTGEPEYMETIQLKYNKEAQEKGVYIVSACGFDSIPTDLGIVFLQKKFSGTLNSVETYLQGGEDPPPTPGPIVNYGTWESAVYGISNAATLRELRKKLYPNRLPNFTPKLKPKPIVHKSSVINTWTIPFLGSDRSVVLRSQRYFYENNKARPVQVQTYMGLPSLYALILFTIFGALFQLLTKFELGRNLLLKYPSLFSGGFFSHEPPSEEKIRKTFFTILLRGEGWTEKLADPTDEYQTPPNKVIVAKVHGKNMGYGITCFAVTLAAISILTEPNKLPKSGGVYTPGAAFAETSIIEQLQKLGLFFEIVSSE